MNPDSSHIFLNTLAASLPIMIHCLLTKNIQPRAVQSSAALPATVSLAVDFGDRDGEWEQRNWKGRRVRCSDSGAINILRRRRRGRAHVTRPPRRGGEQGGEGRVGVNNSAVLLSRLFVKRCQKRLRTRGVLGGNRGKHGGRESAEHLVYQRFSSAALVTFSFPTADPKCNANQDWTPVWPTTGFKYLWNCWAQLSVKAFWLSCMSTLWKSSVLTLFKCDGTLADRTAILTRYLASSKTQRLIRRLLKNLTYDLLMFSWKVTLRLYDCSHCKNTMTAVIIHVASLSPFRCKTSKWSMILTYYCSIIFLYSDMAWSRFGTSLIIHRMLTMSTIYYRQLTLDLSVSAEIWWDRLCCHSKPIKTSLWLHFNTALWYGLSVKPF